MRIRLRSAAATAVIAMLALTGCGGADDGPGDASATPTPSFGIQPTGESVEIAPLQEIEGAERRTVHGMGIDVPSGMELSEAELDDGSTQFQLREPGAERSSVIVTLTPQEGAGEATVDAFSTVTETQLGASGAVENLSRTVARWEGMPYAVVITGTLVLDGASGEERKDLIIVTVHHPDGTSVAGISAEAPEGELDESDAYAALRTLRFEG